MWVTSGRARTPQGVKAASPLGESWQSGSPKWAPLLGRGLDAPLGAKRHEGLALGVGRSRELPVGLVGEALAPEGSGEAEILPMGQSAMPPFAMGRPKRRSCTGIVSGCGSARPWRPTLRPFDAVMAHGYGPYYFCPSWIFLVVLGPVWIYRTNN